MLKCKERKGFTLIELVIAIAILAVLLAVFAPLLFSHVEAVSYTHLTLPTKA